MATFHLTSATVPPPCLRPLPSCYTATVSKQHSLLVLFFPSVIVGAKVACEKLEQGKEVRKLKERREEGDGRRKGERGRERAINKVIDLYLPTSTWSPFSQLSLLLYGAMMCCCAHTRTQTVTVSTFSSRSEGLVPGCELDSGRTGVSSLLWSERGATDQPHGGSCSA